MFDVKVTIFASYLILGLLVLIFNKKITSLFYNLTMYFTDNLNLSHTYLFKVTKKREDSFFHLMRFVVIIIALIIISVALYNLNLI